MAIAVALFAIPDANEVEPTGAALIAVICMPVPAAISAVYVVDWGFLAFLGARKSREWAKYWWFVLRTLRRVGKADEIRKLWRRKQRDPARDNPTD